MDSSRDSARQSAETYFTAVSRNAVGGKKRGGQERPAYSSFSFLNFGEITMRQYPSPWWEL